MCIPDPAVPRRCLTKMEVLGLIFAKEDKLRWFHWSPGLTMDATSNDATTGNWSLFFISSPPRMSDGAEGDLPWLLYHGPIISLAEKYWSPDVHGTYRDQLMLKHIAMVIYAKEIWQSPDFSSFTNNSFQYQKAFLQSPELPR